MKKRSLIILILISYNSAVICPLNAQQQEDSLQAITFGAVITADNLNKGFNSEVMSLISGRVAGVSITRKGSDPNHFSKVFIRGISSASNNLPLYIIDGIWDADPGFLIPGEVERVEILKDAVSTAMYGSRGMNGVIIINTRAYQGARPFSVEVNSYASLNTTAGRMDLLSAGELRSFAEKNNIVNFVDGQANTDWQDEIFRNTVSKVYNISASGLVNNTRYRVAFNHLEYPGIVLGSDRKNSGMNIRINQTALDDRLILNAVAGLSTGKSNRIPHYSGRDEYNVFYQAFRRNPTDPVYEADGITWAQWERVFKYYNPLPIIESITDLNTTKARNISLGANYRIIDGLHFHFNAGYAVSDTENNYHKRPGPWYISESKLSSITEFENINFEQGFSFGRRINQRHQVDAYAGYISRNIDGKFSMWSKTHYHDRNIVNQSGHNYNSVIASIGYELNSRYFIRVFLNNENYKYGRRNSEHILMENGIDGALVENSDSSSFGPVKRNNNYPALTVGWHVHNEPFMDGVPVVSNLTIKGGFGYSGNNIYNTVYIQSPGLNIDDIETERMGELSLGLIFGLFDNRLGGSLMYYKRDTKNGLYHKPLPMPPSAHPFTFANELWYSNKGFELELSSIPVNNENLVWNSFLCYSGNRNELVSGLVNEQGYQTGYINYYHITEPTQFNKTGSPPVVFYLPVFAGLAEDGIELYQTEKSVTRDITMAKREMMGQPVPKQELGWVNRFSFNQRHELEFALRYVTGHSIFNATRMAMSNPAIVADQNVIHEGIRNYEQGRRWTSISDMYLEDASYLRVENITYTYKVNSVIFNRENQMKLYLSANNLFTLTKFSGFDPAYDYSGIDYFNVYPLARSFIFGIQLII